MTNPIPPLKNEVYALECLERYRRDGVIVDSSNGEFCHCPYPKGMGDKGYYLTHQDHMVQGLIQSEDVGDTCFWLGDTKNFLVSGDFPHYDWFRLWDLWDKWKGEGLKKRDPETLRQNSSKIGTRTRDRGVGVFDLSPEQLSARSLKSAETRRRNGWKPPVTKNHPSKIKSMGKTNKVLWISTEDLFVSNCGNVTQHNKKLNYDPNARICVDDLEAPIIECLPIL